MLPTKRLACTMRRSAESAKKLARRSLQASAITALGLFGLVGLSGCSTFSNVHKALVNSTHWNETVVTMRNRSFSAKAWHCRKHHFCNQKYINDFCAGFRTGYEDVANGADGCTPAFPPKEYWSWEFQSAEGASRTAAWYAGYPHGVRAAEEDGVAHWAQLPMSVGLQAEYQQAGVFEHQGGLYPIPSGPVPDSPVGMSYSSMQGEEILVEPAMPPQAMPQAMAPEATVPAPPTETDIGLDP